MANFSWSFLAQKWPLKLNLRMPLFQKWHPEVQISNLYFQKWHPVAQISNLYFSKVASGGSISGVIFGPEKNDHKKLAIRKKSTILGFLPSDFNTQLAMPIELQKKKLWKWVVIYLPKLRSKEIWNSTGQAVYSGYISIFITLKCVNISRLLM